MHDYTVYIAYIYIYIEKESRYKVTSQLCQQSQWINVVFTHILAPIGLSGHAKVSLFFHEPQNLYSPRHLVIFSDDDWGVQSPPKRIVFRFHETILRRRARIPRAVYGSGYNWDDFVSGNQFRIYWLNWTSHEISRSLLCNNAAANLVPSPTNGLFQ